MVQLELLWVAAALMLLGATVSLCVKCQHSGKVTESSVRFGVLPVTVVWAGGVTLAGPFPLGMSPPGGFGSAQPSASSTHELCPCGGAPYAGRGLCWWPRSNRPLWTPGSCCSPSLGWAQCCGLQTPLHGGPWWLWDPPAGPSPATQTLRGLWGDGQGEGRHGGEAGG